MLRNSQSASIVDASDLGGQPHAAMLWLIGHPFGISVLVVTASIVTQVLAFALTEQRLLWPQVVFVIVSSAPLFWRRRAPFVALCTTAIFGAIGLWVFSGAGAVNLPFAFALYSLASTASFRLAAIGYAVGVGLPALSALGLFLTNGQSFSPMVLDPSALIAMSVGLAVNNRNQRQESLAALINQQLENARAIERGRIAAEMHDIVAHSISIMIALADGASTGWQKHPDRSAAALRNLSDIGRTALGDMRRILHLLRDSDADLADALHHSGHNLPTLSELVEMFRTAGLPVQVTHAGSAIPDHPALATTLYRIIQEGLTNALRYAEEATLVEVRIDFDGTTIMLTISDDGHAPVSGAPSQGSGRGLQGIKERAAAYAGTSSSGRTHTGGWRTTATLQLNNTSNADFL